MKSKKTGKAVATSSPKKVGNIVPQQEFAPPPNFPQLPPVID
jgi:hypothetical protein